MRGIENVYPYFHSDLHTQERDPLLKLTRLHARKDFRFITGKAGCPIFRAVPV